MEVEIRLFATLRRYLPSKGSDYNSKIELPEGTTIDGLLDKLGIPSELPKLILRNGSRAQREEMLEEGDIISIFPPVAGGRCS